MKYLERGRAPVPEGLAVVFMAKSLRALRRLVAAPALVAGEEGAAVRFFVYHPALGEVVERLLGMAAAGGLRHLGIAPREFLHTLGVPGEVEGAVEAFRSVVDRVFEIARHAPRLGEYRPSVGRELRLLLNYGLYKWVEAQERYKPVVELLKGDEGVEARGEWWRVVEAAVGYEVGRRLVELWRREAGRDRSVLWEWFVDPPIAPGVLLAVAENIAERNAAEAQYKLEVLKAFLKWLASPSQLAPETDPSQWRTDNPLFQTAVRIYAEATGRRFDAAWGEAVRRLREIQPPALREEERGKTTEAHAAKSVEKPAQASRDAGRAEAAGGREGAAAVVVGVIPPRLRDVEAAEWLAGRMGRGELGEVFKRRADRAVERVKARYGERLRRGGEALLELAEQAARWAYDAALAVASSRGAVAYVLELLDAAEGPVFGLKPRTPMEADASKIFAKVGEYVRRAEAEFGEGLLVWSFARAVAEAVLKEAQRLWDEAYRGVASVERALAAAAATAAGAAALAATHDALLSTAVVSATAAAIALAKEGAYDKAVEHVKKAAETAYEALREWLERAKIALERVYELFVEVVARVVAWIDEHRAWLFLAAAASAGIIAWTFAHDVFGSVQLGKLAEAVSVAPLFAREAPARPERVKREVAEAWVERGEPLLREREKLYEAVKEGKAGPEELRSLGSPERAAAVLVAHAFRKAAEAYLREGSERAVVVFKQELNVVREGLKKIIKKEPWGGGFIQQVLQQLEIDEGRVEALAYGNRNVVRGLEGATAAEKALAALHTLEAGGAYTKAVAGALHLHKFVELLETEPKTAYERYYENWRGTVQNLIEKVKLERRLAPGFAEEELQKELERAAAEAANKKEAAKRVGEILQSRLRGVEKAPVNVLALAGLLATDVTFEKENRAVKLSTTHLGMAELFVRVFGLSSISVNFRETRHGGRPQMELRAEPPQELLQQYGRVLKWLAEEGGWEQLRNIVKEGVEMLKKAVGEGDGEVRKVDPRRVAEEVVHELRKVYEEAVKEVGETLDRYTQPEEYWAGVAREMAFENASLTRYFLSWLSAYLWAAEGREERAVADFLTANKAVAEYLTAAVMGDGSIQTREVTLAVGRFSADEEKTGSVTHVHKAALALGVLARAGYAPERVYAKVEGKSRWFELAWGVDAAKSFLSNASLWLYAVELAGGNDNIKQKFQKALEVVGVEARLEDFTAKGKRPSASLVVRLGGEEVEFPIRLSKSNAVQLLFETTDREEAERRAAVLKAVGVRAEVGKHYEKSRNRDKWHIVATTNALAADSVHEAVRKAVAEFLQRCREVGGLAEDTYRRLAAKFERGVPEWGDLRFSIWLTKDGVVDVKFEPRDPQSFTKAVELLRGLGMRDSCEGDWCIVHFTAREPEGGRQGYIRITVDGLRYIGWLALHGDEKAQRLKEMLLKEAEAKGVEVRERLEEYFREGEMWGSVKPPIEKEVDVDGKRLKVRVEEVEAGVERGETKELLVIKIKAKVIEGNSEVAVEKEARFYKERHGAVRGYVNIHGDTEETREADYMRTAAVLKTLGVEKWRREERRIRLTGGALDAFMRLGPVCATLGIYQKKT
ncbi:PaRep2b-like protein [Pyrobaculum ferrireducens]|uniref:PaRep2b-like protein n=2 Tax=Pyrobaculum ferrireducens TaxID=1104324 RepID=G7VFX7_9CREN|nr:PaRep2b-like protein [Pyrobaculum ferrireducens]